MISGKKHDFRAKNQNKIDILLEIMCTLTERLYSLIWFPETAIIREIIQKQIEYIADNMIYLSMDCAVIACEFKEEI
jgi:hypothetical protein